MDVEKDVQDFFFLNGRFVSKQKVRKNDFKFGKNFDFDYWRSMIGGDDSFFIWTIRKVIILLFYISILNNEISRRIDY